MLEGTYRQFLNAVAYSRLTTRADIPDRRLNIGEAENLRSVPVLIFKELKPQQKKPTVEPITRLPYEKMARNFSGDVLSMEDFETENFDVGAPTARW